MPNGTYLSGSSDDWDQDGVSNLDEILVTHTDPRVPNFMFSDPSVGSYDPGSYTTTGYYDPASTTTYDTSNPTDTTTTDPAVTDITYTMDPTVMYACTCGGSHANSTDCAAAAQAAADQAAADAAASTSGSEDQSTCTAPP
jgi:hypothetical protein